eukprot:scaffold7616_cov100-Isochrysis_galbana.AAC.2
MGRPRAQALGAASAQGQSITSPLQLQPAAYVCRQTPKPLRLAQALAPRTILAAAALRRGHLSRGETPHPQAQERACCTPRGPRSLSSPLRPLGCWGYVPPPPPNRRAVGAQVLRPARGGCPTLMGGGVLNCTVRPHPCWTCASKLHPPHHTRQCPTPPTPPVRPAPAC